jgi:hypothetical protein
MNNKAQGLFMGLVFAVVIWIAVILFLPIVISLVDTGRTGLQCSLGSITDGTKLMCLMMDGAIPYLIWTIISLSIGLIIEGRLR